MSSETKHATKRASNTKMSSNISSSQPKEKNIKSSASENKVETATHLSTISNKTVSNKSKSRPLGVEEGTANKIDKINNEPLTISSSRTTQKLKTTHLNKSTPTHAENTKLKTRKSVVPDTSNSRVIKSQYFPSKAMYSNVVKQSVNYNKEKDSPKMRQEQTKKIKNESIVSKRKENSIRPSNRERTKTRTLSPEIRIVKDQSHLDEASNVSESVKKLEVDEISSNFNSGVERPRTATLRKGSIVNSNIIGPNAKDSGIKLNKSYEDEHENTDYNYEDDFESYESDFEDYSSSSLSSLKTVDDLGNISSGSDSVQLDTNKKMRLLGTDEERKLDSGNYDLSENKHKQSLDKIKEIAEYNNLDPTYSNLASLSDEGFEDGKSSTSIKGVQFINFLNAQERQNRNKTNELRRQRGEEILSMIRLDNYHCTFFEMAPVSYDIFIKSYGKSNSVQIACQTGDDNVEEETQTDSIKVNDKWTQFPIKFSKINVEETNYLEIYKKELLGVGDDSIVNEKTNIKPTYSQKLLTRFLQTAGQNVCTLLEEVHNKSTENIQKNIRDIPFSDGYIQLNIRSLTILKNRIVNFISFCPNKTIIITVHVNNKKCKVTNNDDNLSWKSIICIWDIHNPKLPDKVLATSGDVTCSCYPQEPSNIMIAGLTDGSLTLWDLTEELTFYEVVKDNETHFNLHTPTYKTKINCAHTSNVISLLCLPHFSFNTIDGNSQQGTQSPQFCTLDETGILIIWCIIRKKQMLANSEEQGLVQWGNALLVQNMLVNLPNVYKELTNLRCTDMCINLTYPNHLIVSTNYGHVIHFLISGAKANPKQFKSDSVSSTNCLAFCPYSPLYFLSGNEDGNILLYSCSLEKPLMKMSNKDTESLCEIQLLQWSNTKPCIFYVKDSSNNIHVWDLEVSDIYPVYSIPFKDNITCLKLSPPYMDDKLTNQSYMAIATGNGYVHLHVLNKDHGKQYSDNYRENKKKFLNYVNRL